MTKQPPDLITPALILAVQQVAWTELPAWWTPASLLVITFLAGHTSLPHKRQPLQPVIKGLAGNIPIFWKRKAGWSPSEPTQMRQLRKRSIWITKSLPGMLG